MTRIEQSMVWFGPIERLMGDDSSAVLTQLPKGIYPEPEPACATCPAAEWYVTLKALRCFCKEHRFISWISNVDPVMACDARERLIAESDTDALQRTG